MIRILTALLLFLLICTGCCGAYPLHPQDPSIADALDYLRICQKDDGGFGESDRSSSPGTTSWAILAIYAAGEDPRRWEQGGRSTLDYLMMMNEEIVAKGGTTDIARTILTLHAVSEDPRDFEGTDYVDLLKSRVKPDGQAGDHVFTTIWTIIALASVGEDTTRSINHLRSAQNPDGGFPWTSGAESDPDDTGAALMALIAAGLPPGDQAVRRAVSYLRAVQRADGGFHYGGTSASNAASDAWVIQGLVAAGEDPGTFRQGSVSLVDHLHSLQNEDGSFRHTVYVIDNPCRMTASAIPALLGAPYPIMGPVATTPHLTERASPRSGPELPAVAPPAPAGDRVLTIRDDFGEEVTIYGYPARIVSLAPSNTEILFALGLADRVVGVTDYCDYPIEAETFAKVGGYSTINLEKVIAAKPDLVLAAFGNTEDMIRRMRSLGLTVVALNPTDLDSVLGNIDLIGEVTGAGAEAEILRDALSTRIDAVRHRTRQVDHPPTAVHLVWYDPLWVSGGNTFQHEVVRVAGGENAFGSIDGWGIVGMEEFIIADPAFIFVSSGTGMGTRGYDIVYEYTMKEPRFQHLDAVRNGRVILIDADIISRAGPRIVDALEEVAASMHPELFPSSHERSSPVSSPISSLIPVAALLLILLLNRRREG